MCHRLRAATLGACIVSMVLLVAVGPLSATTEAQEESPAATLLDLLNEARLDEGLDPYHLSRLLADAAQRHAQDVASNGFTDPDDVHRGSDGSDEQDRIGAAGYAAWTENGRLMVAENVWSGRGSPEDALASFAQDPAERANLFSGVHREIGIGVASNPEGESIYVLVFGSRPNVLPIFINDGAPSTQNREVAVRLTNERARPEGSGAGSMGEAIEFRIADEPAFEELPWQGWASLVPWTLPDAAGEQAVYVEFRDAGGRTARSVDTIFLDTGTPGTPEVAPVTPTAEAPGSPGPEPPGPETPEAGEPEGTPEGAATPGDTPEAASQTAVATPFPTWTPLPSPEPTRTAPGQSREAAALPQRMGDYGRLLTVLGALQGAAVLMGVYLMLRRGGGGEGE